MLNTIGREAPPPFVEPHAANLHQPLVFDEIADGCGLATQAHEHVSADVRMPRHAAHHAVENLVMLATELHSAAVPMGKRQHAVHIGKIAQPLRREPRRDIARHGRRAIHVTDDRDVIARPCSAVRPAITLERVAALRLRSLRHGSRLLIFLGQRTDRHVVRMDPAARFDRESRSRWADPISKPGHQAESSSAQSCALD